MSQTSRTNQKIFISYCHEDNDDSLGDGWIETFEKVLRNCLWRILGARKEADAPRIWRDQHLQRHEDFANVIHDRLKDAQILLSILTPSYINSEWCREEIETFAKIAEQKGGVKVDNKARIFKILKTPVKREQHPDSIQRETGYQFYTEDRDTKEVTEFNLVKGDPNVAIAQNLISRLAYNIVATLEAIDVMPEAQAEPSSQGMDGQPGAAPQAADQTAPATSQTCIYLAETSFDIEGEREKVRQELEARGYLVLPNQDLPIRNPTEFESEVASALGQCDLAVHMIGANRAAGVAGTTDDVVVLQNQIAAERCDQPGFKRLIWMPPALEPNDSGQKEFIDKLHRDPALQRNADVLELTVQGLITALHDTLEKPSKTASESGEISQIYVDYAPEDDESVQPLLNYLFSAGYEVLDPDYSTENDDEIQELHKRHLSDCDGVIIFSNNASGSWLKYRLSDLRRALAWRDGKPFRAQAIYLGPKVTGTIRTHTTVMRGGDDFAPDMLEPFLAEIGAAEAGTP